MKYLAIIATLALALLACSNQNTVAANKTDTFKVWGNCSMCKKTIEGSLKVDGIADAKWDKNSKMITVAYDSTRIALPQIQQNIAAAGYDNDAFYGDDAAYAGLPECCQYERKPKQ